MAALARELGVELFERSGRSFALTPRGQKLANAVASSFSTLERAVAELDDRPDALVLAIQPAMATTWIVPLLDQLETAVGTEIRLRVYERSAELDTSKWDMAIVPGTGPWAGWESTMLFREAVRPFAAPSLAAELGLGPDTTPAELATHNLLHIDDDGRPNMTWREWFAEAGNALTPATPRLVYNAYPTVIQEALAGNGVALGWQHLLSDMVERRLLVPVGPIVQREHGGHHMCWHVGRSDDRHRAILDRLQSEIAGSSASFVGG